MPCISCTAITLPLPLNHPLIAATVSTPKERLENLVQTKSEEVRKAKETIARSQEQRLLDEQSWRCGYDYLTEGALGDY